MARPDSNPAPLTDEECALFEELAASVEAEKGAGRRAITSVRAAFPQPGMATRSWRVVMIVFALVAALVVMPMLYVGVLPALGTAMVAGGLGYLILRDIERPT